MNGVIFVPSGRGRITPIYTHSGRSSGPAPTWVKYTVAGLLGVTLIFCLVIAYQAWKER